MKMGACWVGFSAAVDSLSDGEPQGTKQSKPAKAAEGAA